MDPSTNGKPSAQQTAIYQRRHGGFPHGRGTNIHWGPSIFRESRQLLFLFPTESRSAHYDRKSGQMAAEARARTLVERSVPRTSTLQPADGGKYVRIAIASE